MGLRFCVRVLTASPGGMKIKTAQEFTMAQHEKKASAGGLGNLPGLTIKNGSVGRGGGGAKQQSLGIARFQEFYSEGKEVNGP